MSPHIHTHDSYPHICKTTHVYMHNTHRNMRNENNVTEAGEMVQQVNTCHTRLMPRVWYPESTRRKLTPQICPLISTHADTHTHLYNKCIGFMLFIFVSSRQGFSAYPQLSWNSLCGSACFALQMLESLREEQQAPPTLHAKMTEGSSHVFFKM